MKACPFCGEKNFENFSVCFIASPSHCSVMCGICGAQGPSTLKGADASIEAWNDYEKFKEERLKK